MQKGKHTKRQKIYSESLQNGGDSSNELDSKFNLEPINHFKDLQTSWGTMGEPFDKVFIAIFLSRSLIYYSTLSLSSSKFWPQAVIM